MAISAEQAAAISTAIDNLNKSVQVNEEVLQIIKSMQTTGSAASVAEHATDLNGHTAFNSLKVLKGFRVGSFLSDAETYYGADFKTTYKDGDKQGTTNIQMFGCLGQANGAIAAISGYARNTDFANSDISGKGIFSINAYSKASTGTRLYSSLNLRASNDGKGQAYIGVIDSPSNMGLSAIQYTFNSDNYTPSKIADLGSTTFQWKDIYLQNSPTVSSDRRLKQDFASVPEAVFKAWSNVRFCQYKFKEAVEKKGAEARLHVGLVAQEILEAFEAQGLDATKYGIVCHDSWEDQYQDVEVGTKPAILNEKGEVIKPEEPIIERQLIKPAGDLWTVRYEEALALEAAYQRWKLQKIEEALKAKGILL